MIECIVVLVLLAFVIGFAGEAVEREKKERERREWELRKRNMTPRELEALKRDYPPWMVRDI